MRNLKSVIMIILLVLLTVSVSLGPVLYNVYKDAARLNKSGRMTYEPYTKRTVSAEEFAILYSKGVIANNSSLLSGINEETPDADSVGEELTAILQKAFETDKNLKSAILEAVSAPLEEYTEDRILFVSESYTTTFCMVTAFFINGDKMLNICYEKGTGVIVSADYREFGKKDTGLIDSCDKVLNYYYCEILKLNINRYYFSPLIISNETRCQFGIHQGTMADTEIIYYN